VEIADSARKHGVSDEDIEHQLGGVGRASGVVTAVRLPLRVVPSEGRDLVIGPDRSGRLLEIVILDDDPNDEPNRDPRDAVATQVSRLPEVISMARTREQLQKALADTEAWLDNLDPEALASPESDGSDLRDIGEALRAVAPGPTVEHGRRSPPCLA